MVDTLDPDLIGSVVAHIRSELRTHLYRQRREPIAKRDAYIRSLNGKAIVPRQFVIERTANMVNIKAAIEFANTDPEIVKLLGEFGGSLHFADARHSHDRTHNRVPPRPFVRLLTARNP